jgi:hypothetical protein
VRGIVKLGGFAALTLFLVGGLTSVAYGSNNGDLAPDGINVTAAGPASAPRAVFFGGAHGSITPGDLFYVDVSESEGEFAATLYLTNPSELTHYVKYLIFRTSARIESADGSWSAYDTGVNELYLSLQNSAVKFFLTGGARYKITLDSGDYYCLPFRAGQARELPRFDLAVTEGGN